VKSIRRPASMTIVTDFDSGNTANSVDDYENDDDDGFDGADDN